MVDLTTKDSKGFRGRLIMMDAQVCYSVCPASYSFSIFPQHLLVILLYLFISQLFQRAMAISARLKKHTMDLRKVNQKIHGLEKELRLARTKLSYARHAAELQKVIYGEVFWKVFYHGYEQARGSYEK